MSFWHDASPTVKGAIFFGMLAFALLVALMLSDDSGREQPPARGIKVGVEADAR